MLFDDGQREDADAHVARRGELRGQCRGGGSRGDDVVDDEHMTVTDCVSVDELKRVFHVFKALRCAQAGLTLGKCRAARYVSENGYTGDLADALREELALVVAPLPLSCRCQRNGYDRVDAVEEARPQHLPASLLAQPESHLGAVVVFQIKEEVATVVIHIIE